MEEAQEANEFEKLFVEIMQLFVNRGYSMGAIYFILGSMFCRIGQVQSYALEKIVGDVEASFAAIPPPIEEE